MKLVWLSLLVALSAMGDVSVKDCTWRPTFPVYPETKVLIASTGPDSKTPVEKYVQRHCLGSAMCTVTENGRASKRSRWISCDFAGDRCPSADKCLTEADIPTVYLDKIEKAKGERATNNSGNDSIKNISGCVNTGTVKPKFKTRKDAGSDVIYVRNMCAIGGTCRVAYKDGTVEADRYVITTCAMKDGKCDYTMEKCFDAEPHTIDYAAIIKSGDYEVAAKHSVPSATATASTSAATHKR
ncbi:MAG: hypothetical protein R3B54_02845 [Bdellovibrionota bacterium]